MLVYRMYNVHCAINRKFCFSNIDSLFDMLEKDDIYSSSLKGLSHEKDGSFLTCMYRYGTEKASWLLFKFFKGSSDVNLALICKSS
jgi:hypothetical protein